MRNPFFNLIQEVNICSNIILNEFEKDESLFNQNIITAILNLTNEMQFLSLEEKKNDSKENI